MKSSDLPERAAREGWVLVAPAGSGRFERILTWNVGFGFGHAMAARVDDVGFVSRLLDALMAAYRIDPERIFATGISNGGILCHLLAGHMSERIAAIAPIVATAGGRLRGGTEWLHPPAPRRPVSVVALNGALDFSIPLAGGIQQRSIVAPVEVWSARQTVNFWVGHNRCRPEPVVERDEAARFERWTHAGGTAGSDEVVQYVLLDQGHAWPGGSRGYRLGDEPTRLVSANAVMFEFFKRHPRGR
jgi:polyhydroxybutyrate depolymerase